MPPSSSPPPPASPDLPPNDSASLASQDEVRHRALIIRARLERLPATRYIWSLVLLLSLGGWFEYYDLFFTAYVGPGLVRSGLFASTSAAFFGFNGLASFVAATFAGLLIGTLIFSFVADRFGRHLIFTTSLLWYTAATIEMAFQHTAHGIVLWRVIAGVGIGVELVTIDTYITELMPRELRGRAIALSQIVGFTALPVRRAAFVVAGTAATARPARLAMGGPGRIAGRNFRVVHSPRLAGKSALVDGARKIRRS